MNAAILRSARTAYATIAITTENTPAIFTALKIRNCVSGVKLLNQFIVGKIKSAR
jgi:hypothetical protein